MIRRWVLSSSPFLFRKRTNRIAYSWNLLLVIYPLVVAATRAPCWLVSQDWFTWVPLWMTMGGQTLPQAFTKVRTVLVSPCSPLTCLWAVVLWCPSTLLTAGTFWTPVSSPDQICSGEWISNCSSTARYLANHCCILVGLAAMALATERLEHFLTTMSGFLAKYPLAHL